MNYKKIIKALYKEINAIEDNGKLAMYIPELANVNPNKFAVHITFNNGMDFGIGDYQEKFSLQSIAKVLSLSLAYKLSGEEIWDRVGVEPSGTPFNSLTQLETDKGIPRNPFINAGAIVVADILISKLKNPKEDFLSFCRQICDNEKLDYNFSIMESEKSVGFRNIALCNFIKSFGNIENDTYEVLDFYFSICSLEMTCEELTQTCLFLSDDAYRTSKNEQVLSWKKTHRINALMLTCGFYDESGEFCFRVGLPGKSGVGGGILAIRPDRYAMAVWSPKLNEKGNSYKGIRFLERFTSETDSSLF